MTAGAFREAGSVAGRVRRLAFAFLLLAPLTLPASASAGLRPEVPGSERLSDERTFTRWAHSESTAPIRRLPVPSARSIARVRLLTEDGFPEVYLVLRRWNDPRGRGWLKVRIPISEPRGPYGPWAFGTGAYSSISDWPGGGVVGIHGTNEPHLIPGRHSHGCIRVVNRPIRRLARLMSIGMPVRIR